MRSLSILGSTGSIGLSTLDVVRQHPEKFNIAGLAEGHDVALLAEQIKELEPEPQSSQWQIIDTLPTLTENTSNKTVHEFLDQLKDAHKQRIDRHLNDSSNT